jgi:peptide/nickel transport system substrate-binding protein
MNEEGTSVKEPGARIDRRQFLKATAATGVALALSSALESCAPATAPPAVKEKVLTVGLVGDPANLNANQFAGGSVVTPIYDALYDGLIGIRTDTAEPYPRLATSWTPSADKKTWTIQLRQGVKFHNGEEFDADSVKLTFDKAVALKNFNVARLGPGATCTVVDRYTVNFTTQNPYVLLPAIIGAMPVYPAKYYAQVDDAGMAAQPVGCGPYKFVEHVTGGPVTLARFDDYWGKQIGEEVGLDKIVFKPYPEDATRVSALEAGEIDMCINLPPDDAQRLKDKSGFKVSWVPLGQQMVLGMIPRADPRFNDVRVRQAFNYGVNKQALADNVMKGFAQPEGQLVGKDGFGHNPDVQPFPYDPELAKKLLADAGFPNGFSVKFQSSQGRYSKQKEMSEALVGELAKIGVTLDLEILEWGKYVQGVLFDLNSSPVIYIGWNYYPSMDADFTIQQYTSRSPYKFFTDPKLDDLYDQSRAEFDPAKRKVILQQWMSEARDLAPVVFLFQSPLIYGLNARVQNFTATADSIIHWSGVTV